MTTVEIVFRYALHPSESTMLALNNLHEVYGIRRIAVNAQEQTIRVEYDATRLTAPVIGQLLRRAGFSIVEQVDLLPPTPPAEPALPAPAAK